MTNNLTWVEIPHLCKHLLCSDKVIYAAKKLGLFKPGEHFYCLGNISNGGKHIYCVELCRQALLDETARLAKERKKN